MAKNDPTCPQGGMVGMSGGRIGIQDQTPLEGRGQKIGLRIREIGKERIGKTQGENI